jgi:1-deoxy-D-xylulose-5-phosphate synthase
MLLEKINSPQDLKQLSIEELISLAAEIRRRIIEVVSKTGGHIASSLGAVDLTIALHYCLNSPKDKIIFDVGHQAYAHKILTGRNKDFGSLRQFSGLSGFPCKEESVHDAFTTGHSSNAVSLALGLACARDCLQPQDYFRVAAVIGDGSLSGGLCFEGLNNAGHLKKDMLVILNTNELSIAPNVGAISTYLNKLISLPVYNRFKDSLDKFIKSRVPKGSRLLKIANRFEENLKGFFVPGMLFEELGFRYFGPLDGHNLGTLIPRLKNIMEIKGPRLVHVVTRKGKGYPPAEEDPVKFHGVGGFDIPTGKSPCKKDSSGRTYTQVFGDKIVEIAQKDPKVVAITAAMPEGTGLDKFRESFPGRFFDVGIAEGHALCFAAGFAAGGFKPVVAVYSTFLQRAYDQIIEDIALQGLPVVLAIDRAGIVGEDGVTHQGIFDITFLKNIPDLTIMAPKDAGELEAMLELSFTLNKPVAIRYPRAIACEPDVNAAPLKLGEPEILRNGQDFTIIALGSMVGLSLAAADILSQQGFKGTVVNARFVKPLDENILNKISQQAKIIFTVEEGIIDGGFGSRVSEILSRPVVRLGLPDEFIPHGHRELLLDKAGLTAEGISASIRGHLK